jgi:cytochrome c biogenesis protein CcmG/thiol:disulfide interchange protein DsbE
MKGRGYALALVTVGIALLAGLFAFGLSRDPLQVHSALVGKTAPDFTLTTLDQRQRIHLADLKGQVVVINFWASWCAECHVEDPELAGAWSRYRDQRVVFLGVSFQDATATALAYAASHALSWPLLADPDSTTGLAYGISGVPETIFVGADGRVAWKQVGPVNYELLTARIEQLLEEKPPA